jgi:hypothetical protein
MTQESNRRETPDIALVFALATFASLLSFLYYLRQGDLLLYGDAVAHINIARKTFDSQTPGLLQLGTVWLPLPHVLMVPFLISNFMWITGIGGSVPSMVAYIFLLVGIFRLVGSGLSRYPDFVHVSNLAAWTATAFVGLNPNLLYLQATAMTEVLYLCFFVWSVVYFEEFITETLASEREVSKQARSSLGKCTACLAAAEWTRYDGWFLAVVVLVSAIAVLHRFRHLKGILRLAARSLFIVSIPPLIWLIYNAAVYRNPLEFVNGPYSARAIEQRTATVEGAAVHPGSNQPGMAALYFTKSVELNMAEGWIERIWIFLLVIGAIICAGSSRGLRPILILLTPLPFYALSVSYSGVPVFVPPWWPFSYYNVRYGIQLLPAIAAMTAVVMSVACEFRKGRWIRLVIIAVIVAITGSSYAGVWKNQPVCFREAFVNSRSRFAMEGELAKNLKLLPDQSTFLMYLGDHVGALQSAGIELKRVIHEGNHRPWFKPSDPQGLWEKTLADPGSAVDYVVSFDGDPVDRKVNRAGLSLKWVVQTPGQSTARVWATRRVVQSDVSMDRETAPVCPKS